MVKLVNRTPVHLRCTLGACPSVYELEDVTPAELKCDVSVSCPAVYEACPAGDCPSVHVHGGQFVIIGKKPPPEILAELGHKVGEDEDIIVIDKAYFADALPDVERQHTEELQRQAREGAKESDIVPYMAVGFSPFTVSPPGYRTLDDGTLVPLGGEGGGG